MNFPCLPLGFAWQGVWAALWRCSTTTGAIRKNPICRRMKKRLLCQTFSCCWLGNPREYPIPGWLPGREAKGEPQHRQCWEVSPEVSDVAEDQNIDPYFAFLPYPKVLQSRVSPGSFLLGSFLPPATLLISSALLWWLSWNLVPETLMQ